MILGVNHGYSWPAVIPFLSDEPRTTEPVNGYDIGGNKVVIRVLLQLVLSEYQKKFIL